MKMMKRTVSILLAMLMLFSSLSVLASAALEDGNDATLAFDTKFYREVIGADGTTSWEETTRAARGDKIRARVFITTDFQVGTTNFFWLYNTNVLAVDTTNYSPDIGKYYKAIPNTEAGSVTAVNSHVASMYHYDDPVDIANYMPEYGYLPDDIYDNHGFVFFTLNSGNVSEYDGKDWMYEFHFTVKDDAEGTAQFYLPESCVITSDDMQWDAATYICWCPDEDEGLHITRADYLESYDWEPIIVNNDMDEDSTLSVESKITFNANGGTLAGDATSTGYIKSAATAPAVTAPAGSEFLGWVPADKELTEENVVTTFVYGYEDTAYTALYSEAAATTANYTVNVYEMGLDGTYPDAPTSTDSSLVGNIDEEVSYEPTINEGFYLDTAKSTLKTTVAADGSAVINAYIARNAMTVKYLDENGNAIATLPDATYYYGATYTLAAALNKVGYNWAGWAAGTEVEAKPATDGEVVTYNAAYTAADNKVVINGYYIDAKVGGDVYLAPYTVNAKTGETVKVVNEIPASPEANVVYVLKSDLPTAEHYEVDPDAEYTAVVKDDGSAELEIEYISKKYVVKFLDIDGEELYNETHEYYDLVDAPDAPDLTSIGKTFVEWVAVEGASGTLEDYGSINVEGNVTYKATYGDDTFGVYFYSEEVDFWDAPALEDLGLEDKEGLKYGDTFVLPDLTDAVPGYEFLGYEVVDAEYDEETRTVTMGAVDAEIWLYWDRIEYTVEYYLTEDVSGEPYKTVEYYYGDKVVELVPEQADILGQKFIDWTYAPALEDGKMPAESVIATMNAQPYVVAFYNADGTIAGETSGATITADVAATFEAAATPADTTFVEWRDAEGKKFAFPVDVMSDIDVYAYCTAEVIFEIGEDEEGNIIGDALSEYEKVIVGYGEKVDAPAVDPEITGYNFVSWTSIPATITENTIVTGIFTAKLYTATFDAADGAFVDGAKTKIVENIAYNSEFTFADVPVKEGYTFAGWVVDGAKVDTLVMDAEGKTYTALYTMNDFEFFNVELYLMDTEGNYGTTPNKVMKENGLIGLTITVDHDDYLQYLDDYFSEDTSDKTNNIYKGVIAEDGSTTLKLYFKRAEVKITVNGEEDNYFVGEEIPAPVVDPTVIPEGFEQDPENPWVDENGDPVKVPYEVKEEGNPTEIKPNFIPADNIYSVAIYLMDTEGNYGTPIVKTETAKTNAAVSKTHADYPQDAWFSAAEEGNVFEGTVAADGSTTLKLFYKRAEVEITINGETDKYFVGEEIVPTVGEDDILDGYKQDTTNPWVDGNGNPVKVPYIVKLEGNPTEIKPNIVPAENTYKVEIYLMDANGNYGAAADTIILKANTEDEVTAAHADYTQESYFSADLEKSTLTGVVAADGSTTLALYYKRATVKITVNGEEDNYFVGEEIPAPVVDPTDIPDGYEQDTTNPWVDENGNPVKVPYEVKEDGNPTEIKPNIVPAANTYKVEIYLMDANGNYGAAADTIILNAKTEDNVTAAHADYTQESYFSADVEKSTLTGVVAADGSTTLALYYKRATVKITVNGEEDNYFVGEEIPAPVVDPTVIPEGYEQDSENPWVDEDGNPVKVPYEVKEEGNPTEIKPNFVKKTYTVEFKINDSVYASAELEFGAPITSAGTPAETAIPEGYFFKGWSTDGNTVIDDFGTVAVGGNTFFAVLGLNKYDLSFVVDDEVVEGYPVEVEYNAPITAPAAPDKTADGLEFAGWVEADNDTVKMPANMPAKDVTYVATYVETGATANYTVEVYHMDVNGNYELSATTSLEARIGEVVKVEKGDVTGFTFSAADSVLSDKVAADGSTVLKVCYARNLYKAVFDGETYEVYFGQALPKVEPAAQEGKTFKGWSPEVPGSMPAEDLEFTSTWEEAVYTIIYYVNGTKTPVEYAFGAAIETPADPELPGMIFKGWSDEIPATMPAEDLIFVAEFEAAVYTVTFKNADGSVFDKKAVKFGDDIIVPATEPTLEYYTFEGWAGLPADGKMPANDIEATPIFEAIPVMLIPKNDTCTTVIDRQGLTTEDYVAGESEWYIYGLQEVLKDEVLLKEYIDVQGDGRIEIEYVELSNGRTQAPWTGTGTVINVYDNNDDSGEPVESFTIIIFGDLNGDSYVTSIDWSIAEDEVAYYTEWSDEFSPEYEAYKVMASDFDKNGAIMAADAASISNVTLGLSFIDQVEGKVIDL